jgi:putative oxidoreductase
MKDLGLFLLRVFSGSFILFGHGLLKVQNLFAAGEIKFADPIGIGSGFSLTLSAFAEFFCAGLLIIGLFPRVSAGILIINMFVAGFIYHSPDPFATKEKALIYLVIFTTLLILGAGKYSINELLPSKYRKL